MANSKKEILIANDERGAAALLSVVAVVAVLLLLVGSVSKSSVNELSLGSDAILSHKAFEVAQACADEASLQIKSNTGYTGGTIALSNAVCTVSVSGVGSNRTIEIVSTVGGFSREFSLNATITTNQDETARGILISDWTEQR